MTLLEPTETLKPIAPSDDVPSTAEWVDEHNSVSLPSIVSLTDLFEGDLHDDELNEITALLPHDATSLDAPQTEQIDASDHPGAQIAAAAAAMDDGLQIHSHLTDLDSVLPVSASEKVDVEEPQRPLPVYSLETVASEPSKKRSADGTETPPSPRKRRAIAPKDSHNHEKQTPNPLSCDANEVTSCSSVGDAPTFMDMGVLSDDTASISGAVSPVEGGSKPSRGGNKMRQNLTAEEKARQSRDRNREHARNTRLRKKAYVEELKRTLNELVNQRDAAELEKQKVEQVQKEQREVRFRVLEEFLNLRGSNERNYERWSAILEDTFEFRIPVTTLQKLVHPLVVDGGDHLLEEVLSGVSEVMMDSHNFSSCLQDTFSYEPLVSMTFHCDRRNFFMDGNSAVLDWSATFSNGLSTLDLALNGSIKASFSPASNKLSAARVYFDAGGFKHQLCELKDMQRQLSKGAVSP